MDHKIVRRQRNKEEKSPYSEPQFQAQTELFFLGGPFAGFQGVDLGGSLGFRLDVGGKIARPQPPFGLGVEITAAVNGFSFCNRAVTALAGINNGQGGRVQHGTYFSSR
jgi:hypothetical protein